VNFWELRIYISIRFLDWMTSWLLYTLIVLGSKNLLLNFPFFCTGWQRKRTSPNLRTFLYTTELRYRMNCSLLMQNSTRFFLFCLLSFYFLWKVHVILHYVLLLISTPNSTYIHSILSFFCYVIHAISSCYKNKPGGGARYYIHT
jgi:hypothetical protein